MESSGRADSKTVPGFDNWPRFVGVIEQNKISDSFDKYCIIQKEDHRQEGCNSKFIKLLYRLFSIIENLTQLSKQIIILDTIYNTAHKLRKQLLLISIIFNAMKLFSMPYLLKLMYCNLG